MFIEIRPSLTIRYKNFKFSIIISSKNKFLKDLVDPRIFFKVFQALSVGNAKFERVFQTSLVVAHKKMS
jgi:hypothetical protein